MDMGTGMGMGLRTAIDRGVFVCLGCEVVKNMLVLVLVLMLVLLPLRSLL